MPSTSGTYIIVDPVNGSSQDEVLVLLERAANASSEEALFQSLQAIFRQRSYCRIPVTENYLRVEENAQQWYSTTMLHKQWTDRCYNESVAIREMCIENCAFAHNIFDDAFEYDIGW